MEEATGESEVLETSAPGRGTWRTKNQPIIIGMDVPIARTSRKSEVLPGNRPCAIIENKNAESPKPENTSPVVVVRCRNSLELGPV